MMSPSLLGVIGEAARKSDSITMSSQRRAEEQPAIFRQKQIKYHPTTSTTLILFIQALWTLSAPRIPPQIAVGL